MRSSGLPSAARTPWMRAAMLHDIAWHGIVAAVSMAVSGRRLPYRQAHAQTRVFQPASPPARPLRVHAPAKRPPCMQRHGNHNLLDLQSGACEQSMCIRSLARPLAHLLRVWLGLGHDNVALAGRVWPSAFHNHMRPVVRCPRRQPLQRIPAVLLQEQTGGS
ncbi:hypothetical protein BC831DRAFT_484977, partial [Entophlyctis helioformis]